MTPRQRPCRHAASRPPGSCPANRGKSPVARPNPALLMHCQLGNWPAPPNRARVIRAIRRALRRGPGHPACSEGTADPGCSRSRCQHRSTRPHAGTGQQASRCSALLKEWVGPAGRGRSPAGRGSWRVRLCGPERSSRLSPGCGRGRTSRAATGGFGPGRVPVAPGRRRSARSRPGCAAWRSPGPAG